MKYNGIDPTTLHAGISIAKEIPPGTVTSQLETLGGSTGEIIIGRTIQQGEYIVRVNIAGKSTAQAWEIRKLLAGWACAADQVTHKLIPTHWTDVYYDAILKEISPPEFLFGFAVIDVIFAIPRPIACSVRGTVFEGEDGVSENTVNIGGSSYARPQIILMMNAGTGLSLKVDGVVLLALTVSFAKDDIEEINIDTSYVRVRKRSAWSTANSRIDYTQTDFQKLAEAFSPGEHTITCEEASMITGNWRDEWL